MSSKKILFSILSGTILEWYDFALFATIAPIIAVLFFPSIDSSAALLSTFAVFTSGYIIRPFGALFFGYLGDQFGRRYALSLTILLMVLPSLLVCVLPTYASIGVYAPILLVIIRLLQGFAASGEYPGAMCYLSEIAPADKRALWSSMSMVGVSGGIMLGSLVCALLTATLGKETMLAWGWRIPFLFGLPLALVAWVIRYQLKDSEVFIEARKSASTKYSISCLLNHHLHPLIKGVCFFALSTVSFYLSFVYVPTWLVSVHAFDPQITMLSNVVSTLILMLSIPLVAMCADRCSVAFIVRTGICLLLLGFYPAYSLLLRADVMSLFVGQSIISILIAVFVGPLSIYVSDSFTTLNRYTGVSLSLNIGGSLFGSSAPLIAALMVNLSGMRVMPVLYIIVLALLCLFLEMQTKQVSKMDPVMSVS